MENYHDIDFIEVGIRIRDARKQQGLTQERAAELAFITGQFWSRIETGKERASVNTYRQIALILGITLDDLFYEEAYNMRLHKAFSSESLLESCTDNEKSIISETLFALKGILERNRT